MVSLGSQKPNVPLLVAGIAFFGLAAACVAIDESPALIGVLAAFSVVCLVLAVLGPRVMRVRVPGLLSLDLSQPQGGALRLNDTVQAALQIEQRDIPEQAAIPLETLRNRMEELNVPAIERNETLQDGVVREDGASSPDESGDADHVAQPDQQ